MCHKLYFHTSVSFEQLLAQSKPSKIYCQNINTSTFVIMKMKFILRMVLECGGIIQGCQLAIQTASGQNYDACGFDVICLL